MDIRLLNQEDAKEYRKIRLEALKNNPEAFSSSFEEEKEFPVENYESRLQSEVSFTFGVFEKEQLIGVGTLLKEQKSKLKHRANIVAMYVSPLKRGMGIGKSIMQAAIQKAKDAEEIEQINLCVVSTNMSAKKLYTSLGFKTFGIEQKALKIDGRYFDDEYMVLFL
ncbi:GNAT family N-acetyltransferase [Neobacillus ginsengisoli]|uniref:RimJ/RimL family protein N-acetyltransferase n=1 Tax=Neobacillus ginsengisoli TaxID=904295 RepID=A0ABT9XVL0_9BACI|nr:GNAT family N-acetyltransferase [Neobacillus ginsengisoli]MDQ0199593.1 RimJ/RimL family protein N-acetyltransferase [Neobacillus ginsengisoli]